MSDGSAQTLNAEHVSMLSIYRCAIRE